MDGLSAEQIQAHNSEVSELWAAYGKAENTRVPITFATDEFLWLNLTGNTFREFYTDAKVQMDVLLTGDAWFRDTVVHDRAMGPPADTWTVVPRFWMDEPECFGCEVMIQENDFAWSRPLSGSKAEVLARLRDMDTRESILGSRLWKLYVEMRELAEDKTFRDLPVRVYCPGGGTHGIFTVASRVRGAEELCIDLLDDPDFACEFIGLIVDRTMERIKIWNELAETDVEHPTANQWGMADDALELISEPVFRERVLPHHQRMFAAMSTGPRHTHLCGHAEQHFGTLYHELGIRSLDGPGTFVDHGALLAEMPELTISAQCDHVILDHGPAGAIDEMMRGMLTPGAKRPGRFSISGFLFRDTPLEHVAAMYESGKRHGQIG